MASVANVFTHTLFMLFIQARIENADQFLKSLMERTRVVGNGGFDGGSIFGNSESTNFGICGELAMSDFYIH